MESAAKLTAPLLTLKCDDEKEATPLLLVVASTPATVRFGYVPPFDTPLDPTTDTVWSGAVLAIVNVFAASSYVALIDVPATTKLLTLSSTLSSSSARPHMVPPRLLRRLETSETSEAAFLRDEYPIRIHAHRRHGGSSRLVAVALVF